MITDALIAVLDWIFKHGWWAVGILWFSMWLFLWMIPAFWKKRK
jgi:hypothetical protein